MNPRKKPNFLKQGANYLKRIKKRWRKPRGSDSKLRKKEKSKGAWPKTGYRAPREKRYLHPSGFEEILIQNINDLNKINPEKQAGRVSGKIGKRKKKIILEKAKELKIKILNP